jgi:hypothetical protein
MARYRGLGRDTVEDTTRLTLDDLKRLGYLQKDSYYRSGLITLKRGDEETGSYNLAVSLEYPGTLSEGTFYRNGRAVDYRYQKGGFIKFDYRLDGEPVKYQHYLELFPCHLGGHKLFIRCRHCNRRVTALYFKGGYYACRHCQGLTYEARQRHRGPFETLGRALHLEDRAERLRERGHPRKANRLLERAYPLYGILQAELLARDKLERARKGRRG